MSSVWATLRQEDPLTNKLPVKVSDIGEADLYYFVAKDEKGNILSEGELPRLKLGLPDEYYNRAIKRITRDPTTLIATIQF